MNKLTIAARLRLGVAVMVVMLATVSIVGLTAMFANQQRIDEITKVNNPRARFAGMMRDTVYERMVALRNLALVSDMGAMDDDRKRIEQQALQYTSARLQLAALINETAGATEREKALMKQIKALEVKALPIMRSAVELALRMQMDQVYGVLTAEMAPVQSQWMQALDELIRVEEKLIERATADARSAYEYARLLMLGIGITAAILALVVSWLVSRSIVRQLGGELSYAMSIADRIAAGDLLVQVHTADKDEASLLAAMRRMRDNLAGMISQVRHNAETISAVSSAISNGNQDLSVRTEQQTGALQRTAQLMGQLTDAVGQNAQHAAQASDMVSTAVHAADECGHVVSRVANTMDAINASSRRISDIIAVIDGIAFQTNILALNAAVEAARAGEQGRGFAVVAAEVRALAHRSSLAAKEIAQLIGGSVHQVAQGVQLADQAGAEMAGIVAGIKHLMQMMGDIAAASLEQSTGINHVNATVGQLDGVTRRNAALVEEAAAATVVLQGRAAELVDAVRRFQVDAPVTAYSQTAATQFQQLS